MRTWTLYGNRRADGWLHNVHPSLFQVRMCESFDPTVELRATEDPEGPWYGWLSSRTPEKAPSMAYPHPGLFDMCFPYGYRSAVETGQGEAVRFRIEVVDEQR